MRQKREEVQIPKISGNSMNANLGAVLAVLVSVLLSRDSAFSQQFASPLPVSPHEFAVMPWDRVSSVAEVLQGIKDAGMNMAGFCRPEDVDLVRAAGLTCILEDPKLGAYDWDQLPPEEQIRNDVADLAQKYRSDAAVLGFFLTDEPQNSQLPALGRVVSLLREAMPDKWPYVNLFPYREGHQRWYSDYEDYARRLVGVVHQPFLSFDNYSLSGGEMGDEFFTNLEYIRKVGLESGTPFWSCVLAVAHFGYMEPSNATFNLQAYSTLAYGGRGIQYFTYFTPERGNYRMGAIDQFGNKTQTWDMLRRINYQIYALAPTMAHLHSTGVYHYPDVPKQGKGLSESRLVKWISMVKDEDRYVKPSVQARFLVGEFEDDRGRPYLMIVNKDLTYSFRVEVEFKHDVRKVVKISPYSGVEENFEDEQTWLAPGGGVLLRLEIVDSLQSKTAKSLSNHQ
jgi:hypothetical protein